VAEPLIESVVHVLESSHAVGQFPSQASFSSTILLPQLALQSLSLLLLQPVGQHPSPFAQSIMSVKMQEALQAAALPLRVSDVQARLSSHVSGQFPSQASPLSTILLEQTGAQSSSLRLLQPGAQHPSPDTQAMIAVFEQVALHADEEPITLSVVHAFWSSQFEGQSPSQSSPASRRLFPQRGWQSLSVMESQPLGQHASLSRHAEMGLLEH
jgi:hypothetical protein